LSVQI